MFARSLGESLTGELLAVGSRTSQKADEFGDRFDVPRRYGSYEALLADPDVDAVYISTPHSLHAHWAIKSAEARKHILCEKPLTVNTSEAELVVEAARRNDVFLMEAFMYRCHPRYLKLAELVREQVIGDIRVIRATLSGHGPANLENRLFNRALAGGAILDIGCYTVSVARLLAGAAAGKPFVDPIDLRAVGTIGSQSGVDEYSVAVLKFPGEILAQVSTGMQVNQDNSLHVCGSKGRIILNSPWIERLPAGNSELLVERYDGTPPETIVVAADRNIFAIEADTVAENISNRQAACVSWEDTISNMRVLDAWRKEIGLAFDWEDAGYQK